MNEKQARELAELRAFLTGRGLTVELLEEEDGKMHVRVPAVQEAAFREVRTSGRGRGSVTSSAGRPSSSRPTPGE
jgi:hypothetical protein